MCVCVPATVPDPQSRNVGAGQTNRGAQSLSRSAETSGLPRLRKRRLGISSFFTTPENGKQNRKGKVEKRNRVPHPVLANPWSSIEPVAVSPIPQSLLPDLWTVVVPSVRPRPQVVVVVVVVVVVTVVPPRGSGWWCAQSQSSKRGERDLASVRTSPDRWNLFLLPYWGSTPWIIFSLGFDFLNGFGYRQILLLYHQSRFNIDFTNPPVRTIAFSFLSHNIGLHTRLRNHISVKTFGPLK